MHETGHLLAVTVINGHPGGKELRVCMNLDTCCL